MPTVAALAGGVGAARMLVGLAAASPDPSSITAVVNTGDDLVLHGLHVSPDLDTVTYTLAGAISRSQGWGLEGETWNAMTALERYGGETWFRLGDKDLATHLYRTQRLQADGATLTQVTAEVARAWGVAVQLLPMSDDPVATRLTLAGGNGSNGDDGEGHDEVSFQHYFVALRHDIAIRSVRFEGAESAKPAAGVLEALGSADRVVICPSNPIVSIGPILAVPGVDEAVRARRDNTVAVSPIVKGAALKGPADRLLAELGHEPSVVGVARLYAPYAAALVIDEADAPLAGAVEAEGMQAVVAPTIMYGPAEAKALGGVVLDVAPA